MLEILVLPVFLAHFGGFVLLFGFGGFRQGGAKRARSHLTLPFLFGSLFSFFVVCFFSFGFFFWRV